MSTKTALLHAAEQALRSHGQNGFSYQDLSKAVGIRTASIHYHFPTKAGLIVALIQRYAADVLDVLEDLSASGVTAGRQLQEFVGIYRAALNDGQCLCLCVALLMAPDDVSSEGLAEIHGFRAKELSWLKRLFTQAQADGTIQNTQDPSAEAAACLALVEGAQIAARANHSMTEFDTAVELLLSRTQG